MSRKMPSLRSPRAARCSSITSAQRSDPLRFTSDFSHTDLIPRANDQAKVQGRKTINPGDILEAMRILEFGDFLPRLEAELASLCLFCYLFTYATDLYVS